MSQPASDNTGRSVGEFASSLIIREFEDRGVQWLFEDPESLRGLLQIREPDLAARLDFPRAARVNRTFVPADLQKTENDVLYRVPFRTDAGGAQSEVWVYALLEHQSEPDIEMGLRLLDYMVQVWNLQRRRWRDANIPVARRRLYPIVSIVLYTGERAWDVPIDLASLMDLPVDLEQFVPSWGKLFLSLQGTPSSTLTQFGTAIGWALRVLQAENSPRAEMERVLTEAMAGLERLTAEQAGQWARVASFLVQLVLHRREERDLADAVLEKAHRSKFREREEVARVGMTVAQQIAAEGEAKGVRASLMTVLSTRFGVLPPEISAAVDKANLETMKAWLPLALKATTLDEVGILASALPSRRRRPRQTG